MGPTFKLLIGGFLKRNFSFSRFMVSGFKFFFFSGRFVNPSIWMDIEKEKEFNFYFFNKKIKIFGREVSGCSSFQSFGGYRAEYLSAVTFSLGSVIIYSLLKRGNGDERLKFSSFLIGGIGVGVPTTKRHIVNYILRNKVYFSTSSLNSGDSDNLKPAAVYINADLDKREAHFSAELNKTEEQKLRARE